MPLYFPGILFHVTTLIESSDVPRNDDGGFQVRWLMLRLRSVDEPTIGHRTLDSIEKFTVGH